MIVKWDEKRRKFKAAGDDASSWVFIELGVHVQQQLDVCQDIGLDVKVDKDILKLLT